MARAAHAAGHPLKRTVMAAPRGFARVAIAVAAILAASEMPADAEAAKDARVEAFRAACIPDHRDYDATLARASAEGWAAVGGEADPELQAVLDASGKIELDP